MRSNVKNGAGKNIDDRPKYCIDNNRSDFYVGFDLQRNT